MLRQYCLDQDQVTMETFQRRYKGEKIECLVYREEEAKELGIPYHEEWWNAHAGDWAKTDDGYVVQCLKREEWKSDTSIAEGVNLKFTIAPAKRAFGQKKGWYRTTINWEKRRANRAWHYFGEKSGREYEAGRKIVDEALKLYVDLWVAKAGKLTEEDYKACGAKYRTDEDLPGETFKRLLKNEYVQRKVEVKIREKLAGAGITMESVIEMFMTTYNTALEAKHTATMRGIANDLFMMLERAEGQEGVKQEELDASLLLSEHEPEQDAEWRFLDIPADLSGSLSAS